MSLNIHKVNKWLLALLSVFIALNFLDVLTTLIAIQAGPTFVEHNPIAAGLFRLDFPDFEDVHFDLKEGPSTFCGRRRRKVHGSVSVGLVQFVR